MKSTFYVVLFLEFERDKRSWVDHTTSVILDSVNQLREQQKILTLIFKQKI